MAKRERFLVIDIGSTAIHMAEFESMPDNSLYLYAFDNIEYSESLTEDNRQESISGAVERALASGKYRARIANVCISGQSAFMRFVKLPPVTDDESSVKKIIEFEAKQNVPFPIDEVVWDYQLIGNQEDEDDLEVMFAVIKIDVVNAIMQAVKSAGIKVRIVDFSPAAIYNAARANYVGEDECCMLLDIGGKCTTLIFLEGGRIFARSIPIAGASISQQIAKEFNVPVSEAEVLKRRYGFVALGGAYEEPESEVAATISKIIRNVMTRLHGEINRTINIYRSQQKGGKPVKLFLSGGSSTMAFTEHFFSEKLRMEVSYFNVFGIIQLSDKVNREELSSLAHLFPGVVGTALRSVHNCPVEISLSADDKSEGGLRKKLPIVLLSCAILTIACGLGLITDMVKLKKMEQAIQTVKNDTAERRKTKRIIKNTRESQKKATEAYLQTKELLSKREEWLRLFNAIQVAKPLDVWVTSIEASKPVSAAMMKSARRGSNTVMTGFVSGARRRKKKKRSKHLAKQEKNAEWFVIKGYTVNIPDQKYQNKNDVGIPTGRLVRKIFSKEQILQFVEIRKKLMVDNPKDVDNLKLLDKLIPFSDNEQNRIRAGQGLETSFQNALLLNGLFDPEQTRVENLKDEATAAAKNVTSFTIRLRLKKPIDLKR